LKLVWTTPFVLFATCGEVVVVGAVVMVRVLAAVMIACSVVHGSKMSTYLEFQGMP